MLTSSYQTHTFVMIRSNYIYLSAVFSDFDHLMYILLNMLLLCSRLLSDNSRKLTSASPYREVNQRMTLVSVKDCCEGLLRLPFTLETLCNFSVNSMVTLNDLSMLHSDINIMLFKISYKRFYFNPLTKSLHNVELMRASLQNITQKCWHF